MWGVVWFCGREKRKIVYHNSDPVAGFLVDGG